MAGRAALTEAEKQYIYAQKMAGTSLRQLAEQLGCSVETVRKWWRYRRDGTAPPRRGRPPVGILGTYPSELRDGALALKKAHPHWGPVNVQLELKQQLPVTTKLPSVARLAALFHTHCAEAVQPRHRRQYAEKRPLPARQPHQRWQIDGKEKVSLLDDQVATILEARDPAAALVVAAQAFLTTTEKGWRKLALCEVQSALRQAFTRWGRPLEIQTDHEVVYTGAPQADFPSLFTLWLVGLGIVHVTSRERRPTDQGHVERTHRTLADMAWKDQPPATLPDLQARLDQAVARHNRELPVHAGRCQGQPPLVAFPSAVHSGRPYCLDAEWTMFDLARVDSYLASQVWSRQANDNGSVSVGHQPYHLGRVHKGRQVAVRFEAATRSFRFEAADGGLLAQLPAKALDPADIIGFVPVPGPLPVPFQLPLPLQGV